MTPEFLKGMEWLATLGVGGVLAAFMFYWYRKDVKQFTDLWQNVAQQLMTVVKENTASNTKLIALIETMERNQMRKEDLAAILIRQAKDSEKH